MSGLASQLFAGLIVIVAMALSYRALVAPLRLPANLQVLGLVALLLLTMVGGFVGAFFWWADEARSFAWDLPPLASRMLASAGWSFAVLTFLALQRPTPSRVRLVLLALAVYLVPLVVVVPTLHVARLDFSQLITYSFFVIVVGMSVAALWYLWRQPLLLPGSPEEMSPPSSGTRTWLLLVAAITGLWAVLLFLTDNGPSPLIWVWPGDLLTSQLIGVMLLAIAVGSLFARRSAALAHLMLATIVTYGLGLALASLWNALAGKPVKPAYVVVFGALFLGSAWLLARDRREIVSARPA